jgi:hypothetical protein
MQTLGELTFHELRRFRYELHTSDSWPLRGHPEGMKIRRRSSRGPTSALLGAAEPVHQCDAGALRAPQTVALEHEY